MSYTQNKADVKVVYSPTLKQTALQEKVRILENALSKQLGDYEEYQLANKEFTAANRRFNDVVEDIHRHRDNIAMELLKTKEELANVRSKN